MFTDTHQALDDFLDFLHDKLESDPEQQVAGYLKQLHPAQIADTLEALPRQQRILLWQHVLTQVKGEVLLEARKEVRQQLIDATSENELLAALATLAMDELADLDANIPVSAVKTMLRAMDVQRRTRFDAVRFYPDDTAGGLMDMDAIAIRADITLKTVCRYLRKLRKKEQQLPEHLESLIVVDRFNRYLGVLRLADVVSLDSDTPVYQAMQNNVAAIDVLLSAKKVAQIFEDQDLLSAPVINNEGKLLGRITIDDVVKVIREQSEHDTMSRAGLSESTDMFGPIAISAKRRSIWLGINLLTAFAASWVIGQFEATINAMVALAVLMPVIASMGGIAGNQTLALVIRGLALDQLGKHNTKHLIGREILLGLINGCFWAIVVGLTAYLWFNNTALAIVFGAALLINQLTGAISGALVPLGLKKLGIDPALAGGVVLTTLTDIIGFLSFLGLASVFILV